MTTRRFTVAIAATAAALLLVTGCSNGTSTDSSSGSGPDGYEPATVSSCGHEETFDKPPERVVVQPDILVEVLVALGLEDRIVAYAADSDFEPLDRYKETIAQLPSHSTGSLDRETVIAEEPDLFYSQINFDESMVEDYEPLGIPLLFTTLYCNEYAPADDSGKPDLVQSRYDDIADLGRIFDVTDRAAELIDSLQEQVDDARAENDAESVDVAAIGFFSGVDGPLSARPGGNLVDQLIGIAGGTNVYGDEDSQDAEEVAIESLIERNPEAIVVEQMSDSDFDEVREYLRSDERFSDIPAVENDDITSIQRSEQFAGIRFPDAIERFANTFQNVR